MTMMTEMPPIIQVGDVLMSPDIFTECFCCDLDACHGACCVEGDAGAPVTTGEIAAIEDSLDTVWGSLAAGAQAVIDRQGVATTDPEGGTGDEHRGRARLRVHAPRGRLLPLRA